MYCYLHPTEPAITSCRCGNRLCIDCSQTALENYGICITCENKLTSKFFLEYSGGVTTIQPEFRLEKDTIRCVYHPDKMIYHPCNQCNRMVCKDCISFEGNCINCLKQTLLHSHVPIKSYTHVPIKYRDSLFEKIKDFFSDLFLSLPDPITDFFEWITDKISNLFEKTTNTGSGLLTSLKDLVIGDHTREYYRGSKAFFKSYSLLRMLCFLLTIFFIYQERDQMNFLLLLNILMFTCTPIAILGILDILFQLRRKNDRILFTFEVLFYYGLYYYALELIKPHHEIIEFILLFQYFYFYLSPLLAIITEVHMWRSRKNYYSNRKKKRSRWRSFY